jgi:tetratricopeptide (TPR) repeat protein
MTSVIDKIHTICPECETSLQGDEVICPHCLARLATVKSNAVALSSPPVQSRPAPQLSNIKISAIQQTLMRLQMLPWYKIGLTAVLVGVGLVAVMGVAILLRGEIFTVDSSSPTLEDLLAEARISYQQQNFEAAVDAYRQILKQHPNSADTYSGLGWTYYQLKRDQEAQVAFREAVNLNNNLVEAQLGLGQVSYYLHNDVEAERALQRTLDLNPQKAKAYAYLGALYFRQEQYEKAVNTLNEATRRDPTDIEALSMLGRALVLTDRASLAIVPLERAVEARSDDEKLHKFLAQAYNSVGQYDEVIRHLRIALHILPNDFELTAMLGQALLQVPELTQSSVELAGTYHVLGKTAYDQANDYYSAHSYLHAAVALNSKSAVIFADLGWVHVQLNECDEAIGYFEQAIQLDSSLQTAIDGLAQCR